MHPLFYALGAFGLGMVASTALEDARKRQIEEDLARQRVLDLAASELTQGRTYGVTMMIDPTHPQFGGIKDPAQAAALMKATLEAPGGTGGWRFLSPAAPLDEENRRLFAAGKPSQWAFTGLWLRPQKFVAEKPGWITMAVPFLLPTS